MGLRFSVSGTMGFASVEALVDKAQAAEELGYSTFYASDHLHGVAGAPLDAPFLEPWTLLAALAARTERLRLGCLVAGVTYRHPAILAKLAATVDRISGGRLEVGLGAGWSSADHVAYGLPFPPLRERLERLEETVEILRGLWTQERFSFEGAHYRFADAPFEPPPVQKPHPPFLLAGVSPRLLRLVARRASHWVSLSTPAFARNCIERIGRECRALGRDPSEIEHGLSIGVLLSSDAAEVERSLRERALPAPAGADRAQGRMALEGESAEERARASLLAGTPEQIRERILRYVEAGVTHFILLTPPPFDPGLLERFRDQVIRGLPV